MFFKIIATNPYRDLPRNLRRIVLSTISVEDKKAALVDLFKLLDNKLFENETLLHKHPAFAENCEHWNQLTDIKSIRPVKLSKRSKNPWLLLKTEFKQALKLPADEAVIEVSKALGWFYNTAHKDSWLVAK